MNDFAQIKSLLKSGDITGAEALCRRALEDDPDDMRLAFYLATCCRLQGDEAEFRRIMLDIAPKMEALQKSDPDCEAARLWRKSGAVLMEYVVLGVLVVAAVVGGVLIFGERIQDRNLYGPAIDRKDMVCTLYGPAIEIDRVIESPLTNGVVSATVESTATTNAVETVSDSAKEGNP
jgi:hypothetical protein